MDQQVATKSNNAERCCIKMLGLFDIGFNLYVAKLFLLPSIASGYNMHAEGYQPAGKVTILLQWNPVNPVINGHKNLAI